MVSNVCSFLRMPMRLIYSACNNTTLDDFHSSLFFFKQKTAYEMLPNSIRPDKTTTPDIYRIFQWEFPCTKNYEFVVPGSPDGICIYPTSEFLPIS